MQGWTPALLPGKTGSTSSARSSLWSLDGEAVLKQDVKMPATGAHGQASESDLTRPPVTSAWTQQLRVTEQAAHTQQRFQMEEERNSPSLLVNLSWRLNNARQDHTSSSMRALGTQLSAISHTETQGAAWHPRSSSTRLSLGDSGPSFPAGSILNTASVPTSPTSRSAPFLSPLDMQFPPQSTSLPPLDLPSAPRGCGSAAPVAAFPGSAQWSSHLA